MLHATEYSETPADHRAVRKATGIKILAIIGLVLGSIAVLWNVFA